MIKTAFITGATSGFGLATARRFAEAGWRIVATGRRADRLQELVDQVGDKWRARRRLRRPRRRCDAGRTRRAAEGFRNIDLLVNNAGLAQGTAPAQRPAWSDWQHDDRHQHHARW